ncbi:MAG: DUF3473 domain-containing protein [Pseudomonadales bacterium]|nr:DUF3473 domain-containing protein [Pseudomonadales bacterium]
MKSSKTIPGPVNAMTVDVEDYFQVSAFEKTIHRDQWGSLPLRVENNTYKILELFEEKQIQATFFTLGWVAERCPNLIRDIVAKGHELANHGYSHQRATLMTREQFREDIAKAKTILEDLSGTAVQGYRAPSYSIDETNPWAHDEILETGHRYSSSIVPIHHDLYGIPDAPRFMYQCDNGLIEIPITTARVLEKNLPCGGGGYFRMLPYWLFRWGVKRVNQKDQQPAIFYFHPWEIDPDQPRQTDIDLKTKVRHYLNLDRNYHKITTLLDDFNWDRVDRVFLDTV